MADSSSLDSDCRFGIELTKEVSVYDVAGRPQAWRMRISVSNSFNADPNIFMYLQTGADPGTEEPIGQFECVASPVDIEEFPVGAPAAGASPAFFRLSEVEFLSRNRDLLEEAWTLIVQDRDELLRSIERMCKLRVDEVSAGGVFE